MVHLLRDLERLKKEILMLGGLVEQATQKALLTVTEGRTDLCDEVIDGDREVDAREIHLEDECLKLLALHQPVAQDLRFVLVVLKVNNDLERAGDLARNIAQRGRDLGDLPKIAIPSEIRTMAERTQQMLHDSLTAVVESDTELARRVLISDDEVDTLHARIFQITKDSIRADLDKLDSHIQLLSVSRYVERIADLATNIAEEVVFMVAGDIIRHQQHSQPDEA